METQKKNLKIATSLALCILIRFIPYRLPNFEPVMSFLLPFSKMFGYSASFYFGFLNIFIFDLLSFKFGTWTLINSFIYGVVGILSTHAFKKTNSTNKEAFDSKKNILEYAKISIIGTLIYDIFTGVIVGPVINNQSFIEALIGQIPFSLIHLLSNVFFAITVSPLIEYLVIEGKQFKFNWKQL